MIMKTVYFFPKYSAMGASSRYRIYSYLEFYRNAGYKVEVFPLFDDWYLHSRYKHESRFRIIIKILRSYIKRICILFKIPQDGTIAYVGAELMPGLPYIAEKILVKRHIPYILEYDDAIFHCYDSGSKIKEILLGNRTSKTIKNASHVICGCRYLHDYCSKYNTELSIIPTCIDKKRYIDPPKAPNEFVIGWIGSSYSSKHIKVVVPALKKLAKECKFRLRLVGFDKVYENELKGLPYEIVEWKEDTEVKEIGKFTVGIMPLIETPFTRGKCAFKLVQYMAVGIPTISTPLQSNIDIDSNCGNLFASSTEEWISSFKKLILNPQMCRLIGERNKAFALNHYTFQNNWGNYVRIFENIHLGQYE